MGSGRNLRLSGDDNLHVYFDGLIDEPSLYDRALSAAEIQAIYQAGTAGKRWPARSGQTPPTPPPNAPTKPASR